MIIECSVCKRVRPKGTNEWVVMTPEERRVHHFENKGKYSHSLCLVCEILTYREMGSSEEEINRAVAVAFTSAPPPAAPPPQAPPQP